MGVDDEDSKEGLPFSSRVAKMFKKRLPIFTWLPIYNKTDLVSDLIAGITVGLTVVPQSMAYAAIAGLTPEYGLYSSYLGALIYVILGTTRQATIGPTAVMGLLTYQTCGQDYPACAILTGFYAGIFELIMAFLQLGWVVSFISEPVTVGFTSGAAMTIMSSQIKSFLGQSGEKGDGFLTYWKAIFRDINTVKAGDATLGIICFIVLMLLRKLKDVNHRNKHIKTAFWLISLSRNAIIILITSLLAYLWKEPPFKLTGKVRGGFPTIQPPQFELPYRPTMINETLIETDEYYSFWDTWSVLKTGPLVIALISILQNVAISKAFGAGQTVDATQEMLALGTASFTGGFFSSIPISASFSRSAVNDASGVRSPMGGAYTGIIVILALSFLTPSFYYIPKASLSAVIIAAVIFMIDYEAVIPMWKISKIDCIACIITFIASMFLGMEYGILIGVVVSVGALLLKSLRPALKTELKVERSTGVDYILVTPEAGLYFPSVDHIITQVQKLTLKNKECSVVLLDFSQWTACDYTAATTLVSLNKGLKKNEKILGFLNCSPVWVHNFKVAGLKEPPLVHQASISTFIREKMKLPPKTEGDTRGSMDSVVLGVVNDTLVTERNGGMMEGVGTISMASTGSGLDELSLASSTKPIVSSQK
ncbi:unnamed protein product [Orchesella dallaii]|uniref:SLC26A/SulP transporter domain-containing protein n=1 Tax=Orchesella dallaii TaxID=48710 RepID=A0ABP1QVH9_9HEXA